jgi:antitoxin ParD1/3/4
MPARAPELANFAEPGILPQRLEERLDMPTRNISLTPEQDAFVAKVIETGEYQNASEALRDALRALQQRRREDVLKLKALRTQIRIGVEALRRDEFVEVTDVDLDAYLERFKIAPRRRAR